MGRVNCRYSVGGTSGDITKTTTSNGEMQVDKTEWSYDDNSETGVLESAKFDDGSSLERGWENDNNELTGEFTSLQNGSWSDQAVKDVSNGVTISGSDTTQFGD